MKRPLSFNCGFLLSVLISLFQSMHWRFFPLQIWLAPDISLIFLDHPSFNDPGWTRGTVTINSSGTVTGGTLVDSDGFSTAVIGGSVSLDRSGVFFGVIMASAITSTILWSRLPEP